MTVRAIPLAGRGFVPTDPTYNPVRWYLEDATTGRVIDTLPHLTAADAETFADTRGWNVTDRVSTKG